MSENILVCGSVAFDTIAVFEGYFKDHIVAGNIQSLSVSFLVPSMRKEYGGCAGNIAYNLNLLGGCPVPVGTVGADAADYLHHMESIGLGTRQIGRASGRERVGYVRGELGGRRFIQTT